jgi:AcrR family transcriptional regulator
MSPSPGGAGAPERLQAEQRREALLDVAQELVAEGGPRNVTMGTVADRAEVTRALVYKHFANKGDILAALYRREAGTLDRALRRKVADAPDGFEPKLRAFIHAVIDAVGTHEEIFAPLRSFGRDAINRREQRAWDRRTLAYFTELAVADLGMDEPATRAALGILFSGTSSLLAQAQANRDPDHHVFLENLFVEMTLASLAAVARRD